MADITVQSSASVHIELRSGLWGPYWADADNGVIIYIDNIQDLSKSVTADGGATWTNSVIVAGTAKRTACFFDGEVPGDAGTLIHIAWFDELVDTLYYLTVDASGGTEGTIRTVDNTVTVDPQNADNQLGICKAVGGNVVIAGRTETELVTYKSNDNFAANKTAIASPFEDVLQDDVLYMFPANTADNQDVMCVFWDVSASELSAKMYDDSANTWTETSITTSVTESTAGGAVRHSDSHVIFALHYNDDTTTDDLLVFDINPNSIASPGVSALTNVFTDQAESSEIAVAINQQNDDIYVAYCKGGVWNATVDVVFHKSTDGGTTWGTEQAYSEAAADDIRRISSPRSIGSSGGKIQWAFFNDDTAGVFVNTTNDVEIAAASVGTDILSASSISSGSSVGSPAITQVHSLSGTGITSASIVQNPVITGTHILSASGVSSATSEGTPVLTQVNTLTGTGIASSSIAGSPDITQVHNISANSLASTSLVDSATISQLHVLSGTGIASTPTLGNPALSETHSLAAVDIASASIVGSPGITQVHNIEGVGLTSATDAGNAAITQVHGLVPDGLVSGSTVGTPVLSQSSVLNADSIVSGTTVGSPGITQVQDLSAQDITSASIISVPVITQVHNIAANEIASSSTVGTPDIVEIVGGDSLSANGISAGTQVDTPGLSQVHVLVGDDITSGSSVESPAFSQLHVLGAGSLVSSSLISSPVIGSGYSFATGTVSISTIVGSPVISQICVLSADGITCLSTIGTTGLVGGEYDVSVTGGGITDPETINSRILEGTSNSRILSETINSRILENAINSTITDISI